MVHDEVLPRGSGNVAGSRRVVRLVQSQQNDHLVKAKRKTQNKETRSN